MRLSLRVAVTLGALGLAAACAQDRNAAVADTSALAAACGDDCSKATSTPCFEGVCDGATGTCKVVASADGSTCDDGQFCTVGDSCQSGVCRGGSPNPCGTNDCLQGVCNEDLDSCTLASRPDGLPCRAEDNLCITDASCRAGACVGTVKDCRYAEGVDECHNGTCDPKTGACAIAPGNDGAACHEDGQCTDAQTCFQGKCQGGRQRDAFYYSTDTTACHAYSCNPSDGTLTPKAIPFGAECPIGQGNGYECLSGKCQVGGVCDQVVKVGAPCTSAADDCSFAACNAEAVCMPSATNEGQACDDRDTCTMAETCQSGACKGVPRPGVEIYWREDFSDLASGWTAGATGATFGVLDASLLPLQVNAYYPQRDHTATLDGKMLGVLDAPPGTTFDSPLIDLSKAKGPVVLTAWSALIHDGSTNASIAVFDGQQWQPVWSTAFASISQEWVFTPAIADVTRYKNPKFRVRVQIQTSDLQQYGVANWFLDDFTIANRDCATKTTAGGGSGD